MLLTRVGQEGKRELIQRSKLDVEDKEKLVHGSYKQPKRRGRLLQVERPLCCEVCERLIIKQQL